jgi:hypothetical protein
VPGLFFILPLISAFMLEWIYLQIARTNGFTTQGFTRPSGLSSEVNFTVLFGTIFNWFLGFVGTLAFLMFIWAGFSYMTSRGQGDKLKKAKMIMLYSLIGIIIILLAYAAVFTITTYLATSQMVEDVVTGVPVVPQAVPVVPQGGIVPVNPTSLGMPRL